MMMTALVTRKKLCAEKLRIAGWMAVDDGNAGAVW